MMQINELAVICYPKAFLKIYSFIYYIWKKSKMENKFLSLSQVGKTTVRKFIWFCNCVNSGTHFIWFCNCINSGTHLCVWDFSLGCCSDLIDNINQNTRFIYGGRLKLTPDWHKVQCRRPLDWIQWLMMR